MEIRFIWSVMRHLGDFWNGGTTPRVPLDFPVESTPSCCVTGTPESFTVKAGKGSLIGSGGGERGLLLSCGVTLSVPLEWRWLCRGTS